MNFFSCWLHFVLIGVIVIYTVLQLFFYLVLSEKKKEKDKKSKNKVIRWFQTLSTANIAFIVNISLNLILVISLFFVPHCWFCTLLLILDLIWVLIAIAFLFFRNQIVDSLLKNAKKHKKTAKNAKWISKLTAWKNEMEFDNAAITLGEAFKNAPSLNPSKSVKLEKLNKLVKKFGDCDVKQNENFGGKMTIQNCWTYFAMVKSDKGKIVKKTFAYVFDIKKNGGKDKGAVLLIRVEPKDFNEVFRFYKNAAVSKFPFGREFIAFPLTDFVSIESCEIYLRMAYDYAIKNLEENEFDKMSKKIKM